jgi:histidine ammonia-lyase
VTVTVDSSRDLDLEAVHRVAWGGEQVVIGEEARRRMQAAREGFHELLAQQPDLFVYGVTNKGGEHVHLGYPREEQTAAARRLGYGATVNFGRVLPERVVRAIVLARLANFVEGSATARPEIADAIAAFLDRPELPPVPLDGNGGAGEILALDHLFADLVGTLELGLRDRGCFWNGSPCAAALVADGALAAAQRVALAHEVFALSIEAYKAPLEAYSPELERLWGDEHETLALRTLREHLEGASPERRPMQAPVSYRIVPRVLAQGHRACAAAGHAARVSLASVSDNPVYVPPDERHPHGQVLSNGGYHNGMAYPALDALAGTWADLAQLAERHAVGILNDAQTWAPAERGGDTHHLLMVVPMALVGYSEQARRSAQRTFLPPSSGGLSQDDVAAPTFVAWEAATRAGEALDANLAILAVIACEALRRSGRHAPPPLRERASQVMSAVPPIDEERPLARDLEQVASAFTARVLSPDAATSRARRS